MKKKFLLTSFLVFSLIIALGSVTKPAAETQGSGHKDVFVGFKKFPGNSEKAIVKNAGGKVKYAYRLIRAIAASVPEQAIKGLKHNPNVTYVEDDGDIFLDSEELENSWGVDHIDADLVWDDADPLSKGAGIHVAIIDTGIDKDHPDLVANIVTGINFIPGKGKNKGVDSDAWDDDHGHGTHCAGIVAADDNGFGVVGVAPDASLYAIKVLDSRGRGKASDFVAGLEWAVAAGVQIISISLRMGDTETVSVTGACDAAYDAGLLLVKSAGNNSGGSVTSPGQHTSVMAVSAIDEANNFAWFSSDGPEVELTAPGVDVYSTYKNGVYTSMDGTSMACPHVSGVAALVWATGHYENGSGVRFQLKRTAKPLAGLVPDQQGNGLVYAPDAVVAPENGVHCELWQERYEYDINDTAVLTVKVSDQKGDPISGLQPIQFKTNLYDVNDPENEIDRSVTFLENLAEPGTYYGDLSFSDLETGDYSEIRYMAEVTAMNFPNPHGTGEVFFLVVEKIGIPVVLIETSNIPPICFSIGDYVDVRVTVFLDDGLTRVPGADIHVELNCASGRYYLRDGITDSDGVAEFRFKTKRADGTGEYLIRVWASKADGPQALVEKPVCVK
ncbi:S8 family peptidase [Acidobacteriota bacterium]